MSTPERIENVTVVCKANVYFGAKVVSHTVLLPGGGKKTVGVIFPGAYTFNTEAPERMELVAGTCRVRLRGETEWTAHAAGSAFEVPRHSAFEIAVDEGLAEYVCSFG